MEHLLFVGLQLVALSGAGSRSKAGVWHTSTQHWQVQDVAHLTTHDTAGSFLLLGTATGAINYIGKFDTCVINQRILRPSRTIQTVPSVLHFFV